MKEEIEEESQRGREKNLMSAFTLEFCGRRLAVVVCCFLGTSIQNYTACCLAGMLARSWCNIHIRGEVRINVKSLQLCQNMS